MQNCKGHGKDCGLTCDGKLFNRVRRGVICSTSMIECPSVYLLHGGGLERNVFRSNKASTDMY